MKTKDRLSGAYEDAHIIEFDATSKFVWLSDSHRGDGSLSDEFMKNKNIFLAALEHYDAENFTLVEAGDNDELWEFKLHHVIKAHRDVFDHIKRFHEDGRYLRMFGNHDMVLRDPETVRKGFDEAPHPVTGAWEPFLPDLVVHEAVLLRHRGTGEEVLTVHGHQGDFPNDQNWRMTRLTFRLFWRWLHALGIQSPSSPVRNSSKRHKVERNYRKWIKLNRTPLVCGHTHRERFPRPGDLPYFNTGSCVFPSHITALELIDDRLSLVRWRVEPDEQRRLYIQRNVLAGPMPISEL